MDGLPSLTGNFDHNDFLVGLGLGNDGPSCRRDIAPVMLSLVG